MSEIEVKEKNIKAVIFDNHGVLTRSNSEVGYSKIAAFLSVPEEVVVTVMGRLTPFFDLGELTTDEFLENIIRYTRAKRNLEEFKRFYTCCYEPKQEVRNLASELSKHFKVAILANAGIVFDECHKNCGFEKIFGENIFVSSKLKMMKPDKAIFAHVLKELGVEPEEAVLIDDKEKFVEGARRIGMHAIWFKSPEQVEKDLQNILKYEYV
ncbi:MAG: HAD family phosphatase [Patescibacteria group bacterium]